MGVLGWGEVIGSLSSTHKRKVTQEKVARKVCLQSKTNNNSFFLSSFFSKGLSRLRVGLVVGRGVLRPKSRLPRERVEMG